MTPEQAARRWRERQVAQARRDVELETFPTTAGAQSKVSHPMFGTGRPASPARARLPGLTARLPAPGGLTFWGTRQAAAIEHVGGGYHLVACVVWSEDEGWYDTETGWHLKFATAVWLIRPDGTISDPWLSDGNVARPRTQGDFGVGGDAYSAPPYGEPILTSQPKLTRWQEGALLTFDIFVDERQFVDDTDSFWPQYETEELNVPYAATVYRWIGHDSTDPVIGPPLELYGGSDADFPTDGDWTSTFDQSSQFDDYITEGFDVTGPSADPNIAVYGLANNSNRWRVWLLDKNAADNSLTLTQRTTLPVDAMDTGNPGGLTRVAADRWVAMGSKFGASSQLEMYAALFNAKTGATIDTVTWETSAEVVDVYFIPAWFSYYAGNHLHFDGQMVFAGWAGVPEAGVLGHRYATLTFDGDDLAIGDVTEWATDVRAELGGSNAWLYSARYVETCEGCLRLIDTRRVRRQSLFERRGYKAGIVELPSPEFEFGDLYFDQRVVPSSHPAGFMWAVNVSTATLAYGDRWQVEPVLVRYPA